MTRKTAVAAGTLLQRERRAARMRTNRRLAILVCVGVAGLVIGTAARGEADGRSGTPLVFKLKERHESRISGAATISTTGSGVRVILRMIGPVRAGSLAHIHTGPCRREPTFANPRIWLSLNDLARRKSVTVTYRTTLAQLRSRSFSINVHDPNTLGVIACGDIPPAK